jgi:hypothetical protein
MTLTFANLKEEQCNKCLHVKNSLHVAKFKVLYLRWHSLWAHDSTASYAHTISYSFTAHVCIFQAWQLPVILIASSSSFNASVNRSVMLLLLLQLLL